MTTVARNTLKKEERLSGKTAVSTLMAKGKWGHLGHFKFCVFANGLDFCRILVSVPKRNFKRAVKRNLLKRRIREAYRLQKELVHSAVAAGMNGPVAGLTGTVATGEPGVAAGKGLDILFFYNSNEICDFSTIRTEIGEILKQI